jgi:hypothetical protein
MCTLQTLVAAGARERRGYHTLMTVGGFFRNLLTVTDSPPVQAILFLAPLAFNQTLQEAVRVNRLVSIAFPCARAVSRLSSGFRRRTVCFSGGRFALASFWLRRI